MTLAISAILACLFLQPSTCRADAISPLINVFTPGRAIPSSILTILIILVEAFLLHKWIKTVPFKLNLWRSTIMNIASSAAGSVAVLTVARDRLFWDLSGFFFPMFLLTLAIETPLLWFLYRRDSIAWPRAAKLSFGINVISYAFVFISQIALIFIFAGYGSFIDNHAMSKWADRTLLKGEDGYIYASDDVRTDNNYKTILKRYDISTNTWKEVVSLGKHGIHANVWDVRGDFLACINQDDLWNNKYQLLIFNLSSLTTITSIKGQFRTVRFSPDLSKIAVLEYERQAGAPKDANSYFMLGDACRLKIFDVKSGKLIAEAPRMAIDQGLTWLNDSQHIVFSSLKDEKLFRNENFPSQGFGRGYAQEGQFPIYLFSFDLSNNAVNSIVEGQDPVYVASTRVISFVKEHGMINREVWQLDIATGKTDLILKESSGLQHAVSPSGRTLLVQLPRNQLLGNSYFLTLVDPSNSERRLIIDSSSKFAFRWVDK
jgi:hypothetical protein